jgi:xanthosine utilization system XapX-like protein
LTRTRRETLLAAAFALWGLALGIAMIAVWDRPAPADQLPGAAKALGFDAHGPFRWIAGLMLLPILVPLLLRPLTRRLTASRSFPIAFVAPLVTLWLCTVRRDVFWTLVPCALVLALCALLRDLDLRWTRRDVVLLPVFLMCAVAIKDISHGLSAEAGIYLAALLVFFVRVAITFIPSPLPPALAFLIAPLGILLQTGFFARDQRYLGWHALAFATLTPFVLRFLLRDARRATAILVFVIYPLSLYSYANALSLSTAEGKPRINFFEDGHPLLPASEMLRGERPYRDFLPAHGLIEDGLFDVAAMKFSGVNLGARTKARAVIGNLVIVALYFVGLAATGSAEGALLAAFLAFFTGVFRGTIRFLPAIAALACIAAGVRLRRPRMFLYAGVLTVLAGLTSLDFGAYTFVTLLVAVIRNRRALAPSFTGLALGSVPLLLTLLAFGILDDFVRGTFVETLSASSAYTLNFFTPPDAIRKLNAFPDALAALLDRDAFLYLFWCCTAIFVGVTVTRRASRRLEPLVLLGVFIVVTAISYAERHHLYFGMLACVLLVSVARHPLAIAALIVLAAPTTHIGVIGHMREARGPLEPAWRELREIPRARGALVHEWDAAFITSARKYVELSLGPDDTFFDFTNSGILYFVLRRDCPIRHYEVAFYESEGAQRAVIAALESNPRVRAVLVPRHPTARFAVDGIPNAQRAPLVWQYVEQHFEPDFEEGDVVFWRRR